VTESGVRRLPWITPEGKSCYVIGDGTGPVSRLADAVEAARLAMGVREGRPGQGEGEDDLPDDG
jgi:hypothetical protein